MLSDLHFDPLQDPAKAARLDAAPIAQWPAILSEPPSPTQAADYDALQVKCGQRGAEDASYALLTSSLKAAHQQSPNARFVTVTGDLVVHDFECRRRLLFKTDAGFEDFAEKTTNFVLTQLNAAFPGIPVYTALGNNDSSCGDYRMDTGDRYLRATSAAVMDGLRGASKAQRRTALRDYERGGYFAVDLPGLHRTRLLVLDNQFLSRRYKNCAGAKSEAEGKEVLAWLKQQLDLAKAQGESTWLITHIPTGIDVYNTLKAGHDVCSGAQPDVYLNSDALGKLLEGYPQVLRLVLFGHIHADEMRLIGDIPAKSVGAVTTIRTNKASFTVGQVDSKTANLIDYAVYAAKDKTGAGTWDRVYDFGQTYHAASFTRDPVRKLLNGFRADLDGTAPASQEYERDFYVNAPSPLKAAWPYYVCSLDGYTAEAYRSCVCSTKTP